MMAMVLSGRNYYESHCTEEERVTERQQGPDIEVDMDTGEEVASQEPAKAGQGQADVGSLLRRGGRQGSPLPFNGSQFPGRSDW